MAESQIKISYILGKKKSGDLQAVPLIDAEETSHTTLEKSEAPKGGYSWQR